MKIKEIIFFVAIITLVLFSCKPDKNNGNANNRTTSTIPAIESVTKKIKESPDDPNLYVLRAKVYHENEGYDEAIADLQKAIAIDSTKAEYYHQLADVYFDYYKTRDALETMEKATNLFPKRIPTLLKLAEFQTIFKNYGGSLQTLSKIQNFAPQNADMFYMFGLNFMETGKTEQAINAFQSAVENDPDIIEAWIYLGQLFTEKKDPVALQYLDNALRVSPGNIQALHSKATYYTETDDLNAAIKIYKEIIKNDRQYVDAYFNSGLLYMEMDSIEKAYNNFNIAIKTDPSFALAYYYRGIANEYKGDIQNAKIDFENALKLNPDLEKAKIALEKMDKS